MHCNSIFTLGETVLDIIFENGRTIFSTPGGSMLNSAVSLGRLGCKVFLISEISKDLCGNLIYNFLQKNYVDTTFLAIYETGKTTVAMAFLDERKEASYDFYHMEGPLKEPYNIPAFSTGDLLLFGSHYSLNANNRNKVMKIVEDARKNGSSILYDPNIRKAHCPLSIKEKKWILENFAFSDIVRGSHEDFENIFGTADLGIIYKIVQEQGCRHLFLTKGADGCFYKSDCEEIFIPSEAIQPVSSIGAGDTFNAGILHGISQKFLYGRSLDECLNMHAGEIIKTASKMAAQVCMTMENYTNFQT